MRGPVVWVGRNEIYELVGHDEHWMALAHATIGVFDKAHDWGGNSWDRLGLAHHMAPQSCRGLYVCRDWDFFGVTGIDGGQEPLGEIHGDGFAIAGFANEQGEEVWVDSSGSVG